MSDSWLCYGETLHPWLTLKWKDQVEVCLGEEYDLCHQGVDIMEIEMYFKIDN